MPDSRLEARLGDAKILPLVTFDSSDFAVDLASSLIEAGVTAIEVAFRSPHAVDAIERIASSTLPISVAAGTLVYPNQIIQAVNAGAEFGFSPGLDQEMLRFARETDFNLIPGVATPSESLKATSLGHKVQKFFPANLYGGTSWLRSIQSPLPETKFVPTGGLTEENFAEYLKLSNVLAVGGSWIVPADLLTVRDFDSIHKLAKASMALAENNK